jgi:hypothetical protein
VRSQSEPGTNRECKKSSARVDFAFDYETNMLLQCASWFSTGGGVPTSSIISSNASATGSGLWAAAAEISESSSGGVGRASVGACGTKLLTEFLDYLAELEFESAPPTRAGAPWHRQILATHQDLNHAWSLSYQVSKI